MNSTFLLLQKMSSWRNSDKKSDKKNESRIKNPLDFIKPKGFFILSFLLYCYSLVLLLFLRINLFRNIVP